MRFNLMELSGSLGDLGTFIPLTAAMSLVTGMDIGIILIFAGLFNISTGILFGLPIPVQPMKAITVVAIAEQLLPNEIAAAGIIAGSIMFILGITKLVEKVEQIVPKAVIRGIQLGIGIKLILKAIGFVLPIPLFGWDSIVIVTVLGILVLYSKRFSRFPAALMLLIIGTVIMFIQSPNLLKSITIGLPNFFLIIPDTESWLNGFFFGTLPQIPLTLLNSVLAVCMLSGDIFPGRRVSTSKMAVSVGLMNLIACPFGAMPMCHGSGGLAGQYHFGARTGGSVVMLGVMKLLIGIILSAGTLQLIHNYPLSILGIMLFFAGIELAMPVRDQNKMVDIITAIVTALGIISINTMGGFIIGTLVYLSMCKWRFKS